MDEYLRLESPLARVTPYCIVVAEKGLYDHIEHAVNVSEKADDPGRQHSSFSRCFASWSRLEDPTQPKGHEGGTALGETLPASSGDCWAIARRTTKFQTATSTPFDTTAFIRG